MPWHIPMGYKVVNGKIEICEEHRKLIRQIFNDYDSGISTRKIAEQFKTMKIKNAQNRVAWTHVSIGRILENPNYLGTEYYPQIIEEELYTRVQRRRERVRIDGNKTKRRTNEAEKQLFHGILICGKCGAVCGHYQPRRRNKEAEPPRWKCTNHVYRHTESCGGISISDRQAEEICVQAINGLIRNPRMMEDYKEQPQQISQRYRELEEKVEAADGLSADQKMELLYERAAERYKTLEIRDEQIQTEEMSVVLIGSQELQEFNEELYRKTIIRIILYEKSAKVIFRNNSNMIIGFVGTD